MAHSPIPWRVECRWPHNSWYQTIAGFDSEKIAIEYAKECYNAPHRREQPVKDRLNYRVRKTLKIIWCSEDTTLD